MNNEPGRKLKINQWRYQMSDRIKRGTFPCTFSHKSKFTLTELLIIILIIVILIAMVLPALNKSRETAKKIQCTNTLKQYGTASVMYAGSFNDFWVPGQGAPYSGSNYLWWMNNLTWRRLLGSTIVQWTVNENNNFCGAQTAPGMICPSATWARGKGIVAPHTLPTISYSYGVSREDFALGVWAKNDKVIAHNLARIRQASKRLAFVDSLDLAVSYDKANPQYYALSGEAYSSTTLAYRHGGLNRANVAFFDGHIETLRSADIRKKYRFTGFYNNNLNE